MIRLAQFAYVFFIIFGPKIGFLDLSIIVPIFLFPFVITRFPKVHAFFLEFLFTVFLLVFYQIVVQIFNSNIDLLTIVRLLKNCFVILLVGIVVYEASRNRNFYLAENVFFALCLHALIVILASLFPPLNNFLSEISGNDRVRDYRSSGLLAGFDMAGTLSIVGLLFVVLNLALERFVFLKLTLGAFFLLAAYFSSRVSVTLAMGLYAYMMLVVLRDKSRPTLNKLFYIVLSLSMFVYALHQIMIVFEATMSLGIVNLSNDEVETILMRSAAQSDDDFLWSSMFYLPNTFFDSTFGIGTETLDSDVGYVKEIFRYGFFGLAIAIFAHFLIYSRAVVSTRLRSAKSGLRILIKMIFVLMLLLSLKNNYVFVRAFTPVFLLVVGLLLCQNNLANKKYSKLKADS